MSLLAIMGMTQGEFLIFLTAVGTGISSLVTIFFTWKGKKDSQDFELARLDREEKKLEIEAENKRLDRIQAAKEKQEQHIRDIELARLTKETAKGIQESISRKAKEVASVVMESKEERKQQIEEIKAINLDALDKANSTNEKIFALGLARQENKTIIDSENAQDEPILVKVTNFPPDQQ